MEAPIDDFDFLLINIPNANTEKEQACVLNELTTILSNFENNHNHNVIFAGDFKIFFNALLDAKGGTPTLKNKSINKLIELNETLDLCDTWRIRNPKKRKCTFRQKHLSGIIPRRLDYIFISQNLQEYIKNMTFWMLFHLIIHQIFAQYQNQMNWTKEKAKACGSLITL